MEYATLILQINDGVGTITLNRPDKLNSLTTQMKNDLVDVIGKLATDVAIKVVVLTGSGRGFCSGGDVKSLIANVAPKSGDDMSMREQGKKDLTNILGGMRNMPKPVIAAVNGPAIGAGMNLALAADFIIASDKAIFGGGFIKYGLHPDFGGTYFLPNRLGTAYALEMLLTGNNINAHEALRVGLVNRVVPHDELYNVMDDLTATIKGHFPATIAAIKKSVYTLPYQSVGEAIANELDEQLRCIQSEGFKDALKRGIGNFESKKS